MFENVLCVIPARGGSKGVLKKNLQLVGNKPLFVYSIIHALDAGIPESNILVSSDDDLILRIAQEWGAIAHKRPNDISQDLSSTESCLIEAYQSRGDGCDTVITLQPTSPIRARGRVRHALETYFNGYYDSLLSTTKMYDFLWYESMVDSSDYIWQSTYDPHNRPMRQSLGRTGVRYFDNGNIYLSEASMLVETGCRIGQRVCIYPITEVEGMQIDSTTDFDIFNQVFSGDVENLDIDIQVHEVDNGDQEIPHSC